MKTLFSPGVIKHHFLFFALAAGLLLTASFPGLSLSLSAWVALVPLLWCIKDEKAGRAFWAGFAAGAAHNLTLLYWLVSTLQTYGYMPFVLSLSTLLLLCFYLALYMGLFTWGVVKLCHRPLRILMVAPVLWVFLEYIRSFLLTGFPWEFLGYSQYENSLLIQMADVTGVYGVSFLVVLGNAALFLVLLKTTGTRWRGTQVKNGGLVVTLLVSLGAMLAAFSYGWFRINDVDNMIRSAPSLSVSVVQGNIDQAQKWDETFTLSSINKYLGLSRKAAVQKPDLVVWPETALPFYYPGTQRFSQMVKEGVQDAGTWFLLGAPSYRQRHGALEFYNSAFMINPEGGVSGSYDKVHLVPFGEYVPLGRVLFFLDKLVAGIGDFTPGQKGDVISWKGHHAGVQICFEIIFPGLSAAMARNGADILVNMTNDAWFGRSSAPRQHFSMVRFRAVENRRSVARAANTGISGFIDPTGRVVEASGLFSDQVLTGALPVLKERTFYTRYGDLFAMFCTLMVTCAALFIPLFEREKKV